MSVKKLLFKICNLILPFYIICPVLISRFPSFFLDKEYGVYHENKEFCKMEDYVRVLIIGDSTAKAGWIPALLSGDTYNYSLYATTPVEEYYCLRNYLQHHPSPQTVIYTQQLYHFTHFEEGGGNFWNRSIYFHLLNEEDLRDLLNEMEHFDTFSNSEKREFRKQLFLYLIYSPTKYGEAVIRSILNPNRLAQNKETYFMVKESKGQITFAEKESCDDISDGVKIEKFKVREAVDIYLRKTIELCEQYGIQFVFQSPPFNFSSYQVLDDSVRMEYNEYMAQLKKDYPDIIMNSELYYYDNMYFGDASHLNKRGALKFSYEMKEKYRRLFEQNGEGS